MNPKSKEFKDLQTKWYDKLEDAGFKDVEQDEDNLKVWESHLMIKQFTPDTIMYTLEYYSLARAFNHDHIFLSPYHKAVWQHHSEGLTTREISDLLKRRFRTQSTSKNSIWRIINKYKKVMLGKK